MKLALRNARATVIAWSFMLATEVLILDTWYDCRVRLDKLQVIFEGRKQDEEQKINLGNDPLVELSQANIAVPTLVW